MIILMGKKKSFPKVEIFVLFGVAVLAIGLYYYDKQTRPQREYAECEKQHMSFNGVGYGYKAPSNIDCNKYTDRLIQEHGYAL